MSEGKLLIRAGGVISGEYRLRSRTAQKRVTGGRWRRIVLGHVLAEHVVELRGRARVWP